MKARAFAPATIANVAVGFDILGFAVSGLGEEAIVRKIGKSPQVILNPVEGYPDLPLNPEKNTATAGLLQLIKDRKLKFGFEVTLKKTIPVGSGLGGSALSSVAAVVAANALLAKKLKPEELLHYALIGEQIASGSLHADNVGPCLHGGLVLVRSHPQVRVTRIKTPASLRCVLILPDLRIDTKAAREILKPQVDLKKMIEQTSNLAGFLVGCLKSDFEMMKESLRDVVIEPQRSVLIPGFGKIQQAALAAGALGCSISGSGPAMFALAANPQKAVKIQKAMQAAAVQAGLQIRGSWVSPVSAKGATAKVSRS